MRTERTKGNRATNAKAAVLHQPQIRRQTYLDKACMAGGDGIADGDFRVSMEIFVGSVGSDHGAQENGGDDGGDTDGNFHDGR